MDSPYICAGYEVDDDVERVDLDVVWRFLSEHAYWARWRSRADVETQVCTAWRVVGCYDSATGAQVGFARAVSDGLSIAYLADVFVVHDHRGRGLGKWVVHEIVDGGPGASFRWLLHSTDAPSLYYRFGFGPPIPTLLERQPDQHRS
ncbi:MAG TPA: GNAT family N-acetyltransferase [Mycobacteriales bacterium]|nr:GNAT family N-acetyltransferase [Mycobacteriales bacterium]